MLLVEYHNRIYLFLISSFHKKNADHEILCSNDRKTGCPDDIKLSLQERMQ